MIELALLHSLWITHKELNRIFSNNSDYAWYFNSLEKMTSSESMLNPEKLAIINQKKNNLKIGLVEKILEKHNVSLISFSDEKYPEKLRQIPNPPFIIYLKWCLRNDIPMISVVWSRNNSQYGENVLESIIPDLVSKSYWIVSWWAIWVDCLAHNITLKNFWYTVSVIWTWIDIDYPVSNRKIYEEIISNSWWIISSFPIGTIPAPYNFPIRNEIIAWLWNWTLIVEAWEWSWTLITAQLALELNKDVFVVPWDIFRKTSLWSNSLIRDWLGKAITCASDILSEYDVFIKNKYISNTINITFSDDTERSIYELLEQNALDVSDIADKLGLSSEVTAFKLSIMEITWIIKLDITWRYKITRVW